MNVGKMVVVAALALAGASAQAKDDALVADMVALEKAYINPLFFTNNMNPPKAASSMVAFVAEWKAFAARYREYRPSEKNWIAHFGVVDGAIAQAQPIIDSAMKAFKAGDKACVLLACPALVPAHDALEAIRYELRDLRIHNGFPKFVTDELTAFHDPMEAIVLTFKGRSLDQVRAEELTAVADWLHEAIFLWARVQKNPIDAAFWGFTAAQQQAVLDRVALEDATIEALAALWDAGDLAGFAARSMSLKANFVPVYTSFAGDPLLNKLP